MACTAVLVPDELQLRDIQRRLRDNVLTWLEVDDLSASADWHPWPEATS